MFASVRLGSAKSSPVMPASGSATPKLGSTKLTYSAMCSSWVGSCSSALAMSWLWLTASTSSGLCSICSTKP